MTDRIAGFLVTLDQDIREDDVEPLLAAIRQFRHVLTVEPVVSDVTLIIATRRVRHDLLSKLYATFEAD